MLLVRGNYLNKGSIAFPPLLKVYPFRGIQVFILDKLNQLNLVQRQNLLSAICDYLLCINIRVLLTFLTSGEFFSGEQFCHSGVLLVVCKIYSTDVISHLDYISPQLK